MSAVVNSDESAGVLLADARGKVTSALGALPGGSSSLDFLDKADKARLSLGIRADGTPQEQFFGEDGKALQRLPSAR